MSISNIIAIIKENQCEQSPYKASHSHIEQFVIELYDILFTAVYPKDEINMTRKLQSIKISLNDILYDLYKDNQKAFDHTETFFDALEAIVTTLFVDAKAAYDADPAATSLQEILNAYPGFYAIALYRFAHQLAKMDIPLLPRMITEYAHNQTGIDIHPKATIAEGFVIDHGTGIVIGETAIIGKHVTIYQGVTLGAIFVEKSLAEQKRHPTIEEHVVIYANATILGGKTVIGHHSIIGGNVWLTKSTDPHTIAYQNASITIRDNSPLPEPINFVI